MRRTIADALPRCKPMRQERYAAMARHHCHARTLIAKRGEMRLDIPMFRCCGGGAMRGGMDVVGKGQARKRYSKNTR